MTTLILLYESLLLEKYKLTFKETVIVLAVIANYYFSAYYSNFLLKDTILILIILGGLYICYSWVKTIFSQNTDHLKFYILFDVLSKAFSKYFNRDEQLANKKLLTATETNKLLFVFVKIFYIPVMLNFTINNYNVVADLTFKMQFYKIADFTVVHWYKLILPFFFLIDTSYFLFGYLFESKKLGSIVRSVDKSTLSWFVTLACYPPFNNITNEFIPWTADESNLMHPGIFNYILLIAIIILFAIYLSATISLGSKCSNLTNRGTVTRGVYKFVRHPAYSSKVLSWWIMTIPIMNGFVFFNMFMWSVIYFTRAIKEEDHLLQDKEYQEYFKKTPYRFIPKVF